MRIAMPQLMEHPIPTDSAVAAEPSPDVIERAAEWMSHLESGDADDMDIAAFEQWKAAHPSHAVAIERMGGLEDRLRNGSPASQEALRRLYLGPRKRMGGAVLIVALLAGAGWFASRLPEVQLYFADERTIAGEMRDISLPDGSRIVLASESAADFDMTKGRGVVRLLRGELLAEVAKGQARVFLVETEDGMAEVLGTAFTVRKENHSTAVAVINSQVRACPAPPDPAKCITLSPGERARIADGAVTRLSNVDPGNVAAWAEGWLPAEETPLAHVLDELNRWRKDPIRFDRQDLADIRVSGIFPLRDTDSALANLARSQPITIDRRDPVSPLVRRNPN